jgi:2'-hydroxyisoflavone reductase
MRLLVLGGTGFVGGATVAEAVRRGWTVAVFNRGLRGEPPEGVRLLRGDRTDPDSLSVLSDGEWDLVVDTWSGQPRAVLTAARTLATRTAHYIYVSSGSVYRPPVPPGTDESAPTVIAEPDAADGDYAECKAGAERAVQLVFGSRCLLARAGLILGPGEDIDRLPWWLRRIARGGPVLAPGHATMGELLDACVAVTGSAAELRWTPPEAILDAGIEPWNELPIWVPEGHEYRWLLERNVSRAYTAGLRCRPVAETVSDTWHWMGKVGEVPRRADRPPVGLDADREAEVLERIRTSRLEE